MLRFHVADKHLQAMIEQSITQIRSNDVASSLLDFLDDEISFQSLLRVICQLREISHWNDELHLCNGSSTITSQ
jgi:hypothetical protein